MLDPTEVANVTQEPCEECVVAYRGAVADYRDVLAGTCYGNVHPSAITKETDSSECVRPDLRKLKHPKWFIESSQNISIPSRSAQSAYFPRPAITRIA